jgi:prepilin-type N-terminal cleavage/methylation domain-containing protein
MRKDSGFSLMELMTAIAILAILAAIAIPGYIGWLPNYRLRSVARDLQSTMQLARLRAVRENADVAVSFDTVNDDYEAFVDNGEGGGTAGNGVRDGSERIITNGEMLAGVDMYQTTFGAAQPQFNSRGLPNGSGDVYMTNSQNRFMGIRLSIAGNSRIIESSDGGTTWN